MLGIAVLSVTGLLTFCLVLFVAAPLLYRWDRYRIERRRKRDGSVGEHKPARTFR